MKVIKSMVPLKSVRNNPVRYSVTRYYPGHLHMDIKKGALLGILGFKK